MPIYVIVGAKKCSEANNPYPTEKEVKAEIFKQNCDEMDEFVYEVLQDANKDLEEKIDMLMSHTCVYLVRKLHTKKENNEI